MVHALRIASDSCLSSLESVSLFLSLLFIFVGLFGDDVDGSNNFRLDVDTSSAPPPHSPSSASPTALPPPSSGIGKPVTTDRKSKRGTLSQIQSDTISAAKAALNPIRTNILPQKQKQKKKAKGT